ncbi:3017_t:CDS:2, partial [Dentiscutata erythropus]
SITTTPMTKVFITPITTKLATKIYITPIMITPTSRKYMYLKYQNITISAKSKMNKQRHQQTDMNNYTNKKQTPTKNESANKSEITALTTPTIVFRGSNNDDTMKIYIILITMTPMAQKRQHDNVNSYTTKKQTPTNDESANKSKIKKLTTLTMVFRGSNNDDTNDEEIHHSKNDIMLITITPMARVLL